MVAHITLCANSFPFGGDWEEDIIQHNKDIVVQCQDGLCGSIALLLAISSRHLYTIFKESSQSEILLILPSVTVAQMNLLNRFLLFGSIEASQENVRDLKEILKLIKSDIFVGDDPTLESDVVPDDLADAQDMFLIDPPELSVTDHLASGVIDHIECSRAGLTDPLYSEQSYCQDNGLLDPLTFSLPDREIKREISTAEDPFQESYQLQLAEFSHQFPAAFQSPDETVSSLVQEDIKPNIDSWEWSEIPNYPRVVSNREKYPEIRAVEVLLKRLHSSVWQQKISRHNQGDFPGLRAVSRRRKKKKVCCTSCEKDGGKEMGPVHAICPDRVMKQLAEKQNFSQHILIKSSPQDNISTVTNSNRAKRFICKSCGSVFKDGYNLKRHMKKHTRGMESRPHGHISKSTNTKTVNVVCHVCGKYFSNKHILRTHLQKLHNMMIDIASLNRILADDGTSRKTTDEISECQTCDKEFSCKFLLRRHLIAEHGQGEESCNVVSKILMHNMALGNADEKPVCKLCGKYFGSNWHLRRHMSIKTDEEKVCLKCGKTFRDMVGLKRHLRSYVESSVQDP